MNKTHKSGLIILGILIFLALPMLIKTPYIIHIFIMAFYIGTASMSWGILGGMAGQFSLGHATFMALGAYITSLLVIKATISPWIGLIVGALGTGLISVILFYPCFVLRGPYFTLATIAFAETFRNLFLNWQYAGKGQGLLLPFGEDSLFYLRFISKIPYYYISFLMLILVVIIVLVLDRSKLGFAFKAIREDQDTASAIGIDTIRYKVYATFISTSLTAVAGAFYSQYLRFIDPDIMQGVYSIEFVLPAVIGGMGFVSGPLLGSLLLIPLSEFLRANLGGKIPGANLIVYALVLIIMIRLQPKGILGWYHTSRLRDRINARFGQNGQTTVGVEE
jgi:branched-chain amino acid transport system permease protein